MTDDWSVWIQTAETKPDQQLEIEAEKADDVGGNAEMRAAARVEIKRRDRAAAESLATKQLAIAERQAQAAKWAVLAAWGSAVVTLIVGVLPFVSVYMH
jgi:hypothetical protein